MAQNKPEDPLAILQAKEKALVTKLDAAEKAGNQHDKDSINQRLIANQQAQTEHMAMQRVQLEHRDSWWNKGLATVFSVSTFTLVHPRYVVYRHHWLRRPCTSQEMWRERYTAYYGETMGQLLSRSTRPSLHSVLKGPFKMDIMSSAMLTVAVLLWCPWKEVHSADPSGDPRAISS